MKEKYLICYLRLSREDEERGIESNSITNQRRVLEDFVKNNEQLKRRPKLEFVDDGHSGTSFDRPGMRKVLELAESGNVYCIIVKDLSRFGRNYIEVGDYLEHIFPVLGVRFIAVNDSFDTDDYREEVPAMEIAVKNIMNSYMSREQSYKVKKSIYQQRRTGEHVGAGAPYGYKKIRGYGNKLFVDEEAAAVVQRIFRLTLENAGRMEIARILNLEGVLTPGDYKKSQKSQALPFERKADWSAAAVTNILKNEAYIGTAVLGRHYRPQMGKGYVKKAPRQDWVVIEKAHPAIIGESDFQLVQEGFRPFNGGFVKSDRLLSGLLFCGHCTKAMSVRTRAGGRYCYCDSHRVNPQKYVCNREQILLADLEEILLKAVKIQLGLAEVRDCIKAAAASGVKRPAGEGDSAVPQGREGLRQKKKALYEAYRAGKLPLEAYMRRKQEINCGREHLEKKEKGDKGNSEAEKKKAELINVTERYKDLDELARDAAREFVDKIYIYDKNRIKIQYKYKDPYIQG